MTMTVMEAFPKLDESESGLMVLTKVKIVNFDAYLSQTVCNFT